MKTNHYMEKATHDFRESLESFFWERVYMELLDKKKTCLLDNLSDQQRGDVIYDALGNLELKLGCISQDIFDEIVEQIECASEETARCLISDEEESKNA